MEKESPLGPGQNEYKPEVKRRFCVVEASLVEKSSQLCHRRVTLVVVVGDGKGPATLRRLVKEPTESGEVKF